MRRTANVVDQLVAAPELLEQARLDFANFTIEADFELNSRIAMGVAEPGQERALELGRRIDQRLAAPAGVDASECLSLEQPERFAERASSVGERAFDRRGHRRLDSAKLLGAKRLGLG